MANFFNDLTNHIDGIFKRLDLVILNTTAPEAIVIHPKTWYWINVIIFNDLTANPENKKEYKYKDLNVYRSNDIQEEEFRVISN